MLRKPFINIVEKSKSSQLRCTAIVVAITMKFLSVVTPPYIYHGCSTGKTFCEERFTSVNLRSCGSCNARKNEEINNGEQYIALDISLKLDWLDKR